jgi:ubiquitin-like domain-containing CTD phosphatase 1
MKELGVLSNPNYKIMQLVDAGAMIGVNCVPYGILKCKPLGWIWAKYGTRFSEKNTIMFDDLRRNFVMNPSCGLKIRPFRKAHLNMDTDDELVGLTKYLLAIKDEEDFTTLKHSRWERYLEKKGNPHVSRMPE